jgi:3D (Asp-Asp-Asp) domain-containing protein
MDFEAPEEMLIARSARRKIVATLVALTGFVVIYQATIFDSRIATRRVQRAAPVEAGEAAAVAPQPPAPEPVIPAAPPALHFSVTAYCQGEVTSSGVIPHTGIAAADPKLLPQGSVIQVSSLGRSYDGIYTIMDTGPAVQGYELDIYVRSCPEAVEFGRRKAEAVVLRLGWNPRSTPPLFEKLLEWQKRSLLPGQSR